MNGERKIVQSDYPYFVMDDGSLWERSWDMERQSHWTRIPGPPADPAAEAEGVLPPWFDIRPTSDNGRLLVMAKYNGVIAWSVNMLPPEARAIASHLLAAADEAEQG